MFQMELNSACNSPSSDQNKRNGNYSVDLVTVKSFSFQFQIPLVQGK